MIKFNWFKHNKNTKSEYGEWWQRESTAEKLYDDIWNRRPGLHEDLKNFIMKRKDIESILEIGCGGNGYPIKFKKLFEGKQYTGIDISKPAIESCKKKSNFEFICSDFLKFDFDKKFDLVFSMAVIDHVYDIDLFLEKMIDLSTKYVYLNAYRGFDPNLDNHVMKWQKKVTCYHNQLSHKQIRNLFLKKDLDKNEFNIRSIQVGETAEFPIQTIIEINRK